jgi:predicted enzyme related to lactoylglutathione lyase
LDVEIGIAEDRMANTFDWIEIRVRDIGEAASFYESLFGWTVVGKETTDGFDYWIFDTGAEPRLENIRRGGLWLMPDDESVGVVVYVVVDEIERVLKKVRELGGEVVKPKTPQGGGFRAYFADPGGNLFGLWEERKAE